MSLSAIRSRHSLAARLPSLLVNVPLVFLLSWALSYTF